MSIAKTTAVIGRAWGWLGLIALLGAWITQLTQRPLFGMSQEHLFNDAIVLVLLGIASLLDSLVLHRRHNPVMESDMIRRTALLTLVVVALSTSAALAHDGHDHMIMGTVMARDDKHLEVKTPSGEVLSIAVTDKTTTVREKKKIAFKDVQVGRRVVVNIGNGEDPLVAREIQLGAAGPAPAPANSH